MFFGNPPIKSNELYPITSCRGSSIRNMPEKYHKLRGHIYCFVWAITASCKRQQASFGDAMLELRNNISSSLLQERNSRLFEWNPNGIYEIIYIQYTCIIMYHVICIHNFHRFLNLHKLQEVSRERFFLVIIRFNSGFATDVCGHLCEQPSDDGGHVSICGCDWTDLHSANCCLHGISSGLSAGGGVLTIGKCSFVWLYMSTFFVSSLCFCREKGNWSLHGTLNCGELTPRFRAWIMWCCQCLVWSSATSQTGSLVADGFIWLCQFMWKVSRCKWTLNCTHIFATMS